MRKSYYYVVAAMFMTMSFSGCSSEEDDIDDKEGICLSFRLLNERGEETTTFNKGENIFFDLEIVNNCDTTMVYTLEEWNERVVQSGVNKNGADLFLPSSSTLTLLTIYVANGKKQGNMTT